MDQALKEAQQWIKQQQWPKAIACLQQYLQHNDNIDVLHQLAITAVKAQDYALAETSLYQLTKLQADNPIFYNHYASVLKQRGNLLASEQAYQQAILLQPFFSEAHNNLGILYLQQGQLNQAEQCFLQALHTSPEYSDALYNLGITYEKMTKLNKAIATFNQLLDVTPNHIAAHYQLGKCYYAENQLEPAIVQFHAALNINEKIPELHDNLANCYIKREDWPQARIHSEKSLDLQPNNFIAEYNLAIISEKLANIDLAIQHYQKAIQLQPDHFAAHNNLGICFLKRQNLGYALKHFEKALELQPDNENLRYNINAIKQDKRLDAAPTNYVRNLFDAYANSFEQHIRESLDYQIPEFLFVALGCVLSLQEKSYSIADLGCGTGLAGELFAPYANHLVGVDLSAKMLEVAKKKGIYQELLDQDITDYLLKQPQRFDILLSADVFVYIGNLIEIFKACQRALKNKGYLVFSSEICEDEKFKVLQSGRFAHSEHYLLTLAKKFKFKVLYNEVVPGRMQYDEAVLSRVMVLQKKARLF